MAGCVGSNQYRPRAPRASAHWRTLAATAFAALLCGCTVLGSVRDLRALADGIAVRAGLEPVVTGDDAFSVLGMRRGEAGVLHVYFEGDGHAWATRRRPARDPTPLDPRALRLAAADRAPAVAWLARPCQYLGAAAGRCAERYWTSHRYAPEVVAALDAALTDLERRAGARRLVLIGYSGGGAIAALIAARRNDVDRLITVAANLDVEAWTRLHGDTPLAGSLNPADAGPALAAVPQVHLVGERDRNVPRAVVDRYLERIGLDPRASVIEVAGFDHHCCWEAEWPRLLAAALGRVRTGRAREILRQVRENAKVTGLLQRNITAGAVARRSQ